MPAQSVVRSTGQMWKFVLANVALIVGSFAPFWPETGIDWLPGTLLAAAGYAYACLGITCPRCGSRWFWQAALRPALYHALGRSPSCPACGHDFAGAQRGLELSHPGK